MGNPMDEIKKARKEVGMSQWELAVRVGRSGSWVSLREQGWVIPTDIELEAMHYVLQKKREELDAIAACRASMEAANER